MTTEKFPAWAKALPWSTIEIIGKELEVDANLIAAIIQTESGGVPWRQRFEAVYQPDEGDGDDFFRILPARKYLVSPERWAKQCGISVATETMQQYTSHGLMQVMGYTARGMGYDDNLTEMLEPGIGIYWGSLYLGQKLKAYQSVKSAVAAYNRGTAQRKKDSLEFVNQPYVDKVMSRLAELS